MARFKALALAAALSLAAPPLRAQTASSPPAGEPERSHGLNGEVIGYLAVPALAVLVFLIGLAIGAGDEDQPVNA